MRAQDDGEERRQSRKRGGDVPSAQATEAGVLGAVLSEGIGWWNQVSRDSGGDPASLFYDQELRMVARAIIRATEQGLDITDSAIEDQISLLGGDEFIADPRALLIQLQADTSITTLKSLGRSIKTLVEKRALRNVLADIERTRDTILTDPDAELNKVTTELKRASVEHSVLREVRTMKQLILELETREQAPWYISTGIKELDAVLGGGGFAPGRVYVIAARPKIGKTTLMMNCILDVLHQDAVPIAGSLETMEQEFYYKLWAAEAFVDQKIAKDLVYRRKTFNDVEDPEDADALEEAQAFLKTDMLYTAFSGDIRNGPDSMLSIAANAIAQHPDRRVIMFLDYLQLMVENQMNAVQEISQFTRDLKLGAVDLGIPVVLLSQLNRDGADGSMPQLHHLRGSGAIEQDADVVMMLNRKGFYDEEAPQHIIDIGVLANRDGPSQTIQAHWDGPRGVITSMESATEGWGNGTVDDGDDYE